MNTRPRWVTKAILRAALIVATLVLCTPRAVSTARQESRGSTSSLQFEVTVARGLVDTPQSGRLFVVLSPNTRPEPRFTLGRRGADAPPVFATDVEDFAPGVEGLIGGNAAAFPIDNLAALPPGDYFVQALFDSNIDLKLPNAPGNLYSEVRQVFLDPVRSGTIRLELTRRVPPEQLPADTEYLRFFKIR